MRQYGQSITGRTVHRDTNPRRDPPDVKLFLVRPASSRIVRKKNPCALFQRLLSGAVSSVALTVSPLIRIGVRTSACWTSSCTLLRSCGVTFSLKPQEGHHFDIEVPLISISQLPLELVQVCIGDHGFDFTDQALSLFHRDPRASDVPPEPPAFQFDTGGKRYSASQEQ